MSAIARKSGGGGHRQAAGFSSETSVEEIIDFIRREFLAPGRLAVETPKRPRPRTARTASAVVLLVDKPAGPVVVRGRRGAARALRPRRPATPGRSIRSRPGSCSCLLGRCDAARPLPRRARQALRDRDPARPSHGDRRRRGRGRRGDADPADLAAALGCPSRRGRAPGAGGLGRQDRRRARLPAAPARSRRRDAHAALVRARALASGASSRRSSSSSCSSRSGTYVRAIADALGGHCRTLRRTAVGPFRIEDADEERVLPPLAAVAHLPRST